MMISMWTTNNAQNNQKSLKMQICKHYWTKIQHNHFRTCHNIKCWSHNNYQTWTWNEKDSGRREMSSTSIIGKCHCKPVEHLHHWSPGKKRRVLSRIVTGNEKWIYFDNPKLRKSWVDRDQPSTSPRCNIYDSKIMLCIWWNQEGVLGISC